MLKSILTWMASTFHYWNTDLLWRRSLTGLTIVL